MFRNEQKLRARTIGHNSVDFVEGEEVVRILLLHSLTHSTGQHNGFASIGSTSHKNWLLSTSEFISKDVLSEIPPPNTLLEASQVSRFNNFCQNSFDDHLYRNFSMGKPRTYSITFGLKFKIPLF